MLVPCFGHHLCVLSSFSSQAHLQFEKGFVWQGYRHDDGLYLESDTDEQLLLHISFQTGLNHSFLQELVHFWTLS